MKVYVINLIKDEERRDFQIKQLTELNLDFEIIPAVSTEIIEDDTYQKHRYDWQRPLRNSEVACYFSHQQLWKKIIATKKPALILEDDALLSKCVPDILDYASKLQDIDYINLEVRNRNKLVVEAGIKIPSCHSSLLRLYLDKTGAAGYILYPSGAERLLKQEKSLGIGLADACITGCYDLRGYQVEPASIIQLDQCNIYGIQQPINVSSNINSRRPKILSNERWIFAKKRGTAQIKQGLQRIKYFFKAQERPIKINPDDFNY